MKRNNPKKNPKIEGNRCNKLQGPSNFKLRGNSPQRYSELTCYSYFVTQAPTNWMMHFE